MSTSNERRFWEETLRSLNPGWNITLPHGAGPGDLNLAESTVHMYLFDPSNEWLLQGSVRPADAESARRQTAQAPEAGQQLVSSIGHFLVECSDENVNGSSPKAQQALSGTLLALSHSRTFARAKEATGGYAGHWLYLVYRLNDGSVLARPGFVGARGAGLLSLQDLCAAVRHIVGMDSAPSASGFITQEIRAGGGLRLSEGLAAALGR